MTVLKADELLIHLGKPASDPGVRKLLEELGLADANIEAASRDVPATQFGVALFFKKAHYLRNNKAVGSLAPDASVLSDIDFTINGIDGGPPFSGELPLGLSFADTREAVHSRLGAPSYTTPNFPTDRWETGERYVTIAFGRKEGKVREVTCGLVWSL